LTTVFSRAPHFAATLSFVTLNVSCLQASMPDLPADFRRKYRQLGLPAADVLVLADELPTAQYFDSVLAAGAAAKPAANWIMGDIMAFCKVSLKVFAVLCLPFFSL